MLQYNMIVSHMLQIKVECCPIRFIKMYAHASQVLFVTNDC